MSTTTLPNTYFRTSSTVVKLGHIEQAVEEALKNPASLDVPYEAHRDVLVLPLKEHPAKMGFSKIEGQARLLHDLANIELQAMELGLRTLVEFPHAPEEFRERLAQITQEEAQHCKLCLERLQDLGFQWGDWPIHTALWDAVSVQDSLLDRIFIVHRYLEGSGLDAGDIFVKKLSGVVDSRIERTVKTITEDEIDHVYFGSKWFKYFCHQRSKNPELELQTKIKNLRRRLPKRIEKISHKLRLQSGFSPEDIEALETLRTSYF